MLPTTSLFLPISTYLHTFLSIPTYIPSYLYLPTYVLFQDSFASMFMTLALGKFSYTCECIDERQDPSAAAAAVKSWNAIDKAKSICANHVKII